MFTCTQAQLLKSVFNLCYYLVYVFILFTVLLLFKILLLLLQVITNEEAERRGKIYDAEGRTYLFDLDYNDGDCPFTVDAGYYGNVSHFVNHSVRCAT